MRTKRDHRTTNNQDPTTDPVGYSLYYEWIQIAGDLVNTGNKLQPTLTFRAPTIDTELKFRLLVTNSGDLKSYGDATVIVRADKPIVNISEVKQILDQRLPAVSEIHTDPNFPAPTGVRPGLGA